MNPCEITATVTVIANALASRLTNDQINIASAVFTQLGDTLATISVQRSVCGNNGDSSSSYPTD